MLCVLPKDWVCFHCTGYEKQNNVHATILKGSRVIVNAFQKLTARAGLASSLTHMLMMCAIR